MVLLRKREVMEQPVSQGKPGKESDRALLGLHAILRIKKLHGCARLYPLRRNPSGMR